MNIPAKCSVSGCEKSVKARGLCTAHVERLRKHGDPTHGGVIGTSPGAPMAYYNETVLSCSENSCLIWPFARSGVGYAQMRVMGRSKNVHRLVCEAEHGPPPSPEHVAAHSCGGGHLGCVNPTHLSWKTYAENEADKIIHGTMPTRVNGRWESVLKI